MRECINKGPEPAGPKTTQRKVEKGEAMSPITRPKNTQTATKIMTKHLNFSDRVDLQEVQQQIHPKQATKYHKIAISNPFLGGQKLEVVTLTAAKEKRGRLLTDLLAGGLSGEGALYVWRGGL